MAAAIGGGDAGDGSVVVEAGEAVGEDVGGDVFRGVGEVLEALVAEEEVADDEEGPFVAEEVEAAGDGAGGAAGCGGGFHGGGIRKLVYTCKLQA